MKLDNDHRDSLLALAMTAAKRAAAHIQSRAGEELEVLRKEGGNSLASQVVTEVDLESQRLILQSLEDSIARYPLGLLTEESEDDSSRHERDYFWCIDPLDGTLAFTEKVAGYSVSIALVGKTGIPEIGVIMDPVSGTIYHARRGGGAYRNAEVITMPPSTALPSARPLTLTLVMDRSFQTQELYADVMERLAAIAVGLGLSGVDIIDRGGAAMNACWVLENSPAVYFKFPKPEPGGGSLWDYAASACLFEEIDEATVSDIHGQSLNLNRKHGTFMNGEGILYASSAELGARIRDLYHGFK